MDHSQANQRHIFPVYQPAPPKGEVSDSVPVPSMEVPTHTWDEDMLHWPVQVSTLTGNIVHLQVLPGILVSDCTRQGMYADT